MSNGKRFLSFWGIIIFATFIAILLADGGPLDSMKGWKGLGLLILMVIVGSLIAWMVVAALTGDPVPKKVALPIGVGVAFGLILIAVLLMGAGREWLRPVLEPFTHGGIWWPVVMTVAVCAVWGLRLGAPQAVEAAPEEQPANQPAPWAA